MLPFASRCEAGKAPNIGVNAAQGEIVLFLGADTLPSETWVEQMYPAIHNLEADAVGGSMANRTPWSVTGSVAFYLEFSRFVEAAAAPHPARYLVSANVGFRRDVLHETQFVDHTIGEDMLISTRLARSGKKLLFIPRASIKHLNRTGFKNRFLVPAKTRPRRLHVSLRSFAWKLRILRSAPILIFLAPFLVLPWIGWSRHRRRRLADLLRFGAVSPICLVANYAWAAGFYRASKLPSGEETLNRDIAAAKRGQ
jgi:cellulose synthase/poly-beta-1,6-N-acetylglucosamine synthase-like glycosyltransferase